MPPTLSQYPLNFLAANRNSSITDSSEIQRNGPVGVSGPFVFGFGCRRCPTLPHTAVCSTIGAGGLSFRVRDGSGRFPAAVATDKFLVFGVVLVVDTV